MKCGYKRTNKRTRKPRACTRVKHRWTNITHKRKPHTFKSYHRDMVRALEHDSCKTSSVYQLYCPGHSFSVRRFTLMILLLGRSLQLEFALALFFLPLLLLCCHCCHGLRLMLACCCCCSSTFRSFMWFVWIAGEHVPHAPQGTQ